MESAVVLRDLTKVFGTARGISDVSLDVPSGTVFGFLGPNGAGKSTTIRLIMGLYRASHGSASVLGRDPWKDGAGNRRRIGYLPGELNLFPRLTGREILDRFGRAQGLGDVGYRDHLVRRLGAELDRPTAALSKGNRQKIGLILAFQHRPALLVLDEPTSGLDPLVQDEFAALVAESVADGRTVFLSSHDLDEVQRLVHQLAIIKEGSIVTVDTVEGLRARAPRRVELQFAHPVPSDAFAAIPGVDVDSFSPRRVVLSVRGPVAPLLASVVPMDPVDITARPADLDELFRSFYREEAVDAR
jgi:ABC-2 type transport system ATP-binding protein